MNASEKQCLNYWIKLLNDLLHYFGTVFYQKHVLLALFNLFFLRSALRGCICVRHERWECVRSIEGFLQVTISIYLYGLKKIWFSFWDRNESLNIGLNVWTEHFFNWWLFIVESVMSTLKYIIKFKNSPKNHFAFYLRISVSLTLSRIQNLNFFMSPSFLLYFTLFLQRPLCIFHLCPCFSHWAPDPCLPGAGFSPANSLLSKKNLKLFFQVSF